MPHHTPKSMLAALSYALLASKVAAAAIANPVASPAPYFTPPTGFVPLESPMNNYSCKASAADKNPLVFLHGLGSTWYEDIHGLEVDLKSRGFCTFSFTYGATAQFPYAGGLIPIKESAPGIAKFIRKVQRKTGSSKVDLVGHSEGAFQALYVPKFYGVASIVDKIVAIAAPAHGTTFGGLYYPSVLLGNFSRELTKVILDTGCAACDDLLIDGAAVKRLNNGQPIVQQGNKLTVIASRTDNEVTPVENALVREPGVTNEFVQDFCANDNVGKSKLNRSFISNRPIACR